MLQAAVQAHPGALPMVPSHLAQSILVTLFCCLPLGIAAIVYSSQVNSKLAAGDYAGALQSSKTANTLAWVSAGLGLVVGIGWFAIGASGV